jgi:hypothetical protein
MVGRPQIPVAVVDAEDSEPRLQHKGVRNHRIVRIRELLDVEVALDSSVWITQKGPQSAQRVAELVEAEWVVRGDDDEPRVRDAELWVTIHQIPEKTMLLGVVGPSGQMEDQGVPALELGESPEVPGLVLELVVRKASSDNDVFSQPIVSFDPLARPSGRPLPPGVL